MERLWISFWLPPDQGGSYSLPGGPHDWKTVAAWLREERSTDRARKICAVVEAPSFHAVLESLDGCPMRFIVAKEHDWMPPETDFPAKEAIS